MYDRNYADYTIKSEDVGGVLTIKVTDNNSGDEDTITNVEVLQFMDRQIETGVVVNQKSVMKGNEKILTGKDYKGSFLGDNIKEQTLLIFLMVAMEPIQWKVVVLGLDTLWWGW